MIYPTVADLPKPYVIRRSKDSNIWASGIPFPSRSHDM